MLNVFYKTGLLTSSLYQLAQWTYGSFCIANGRFYIHRGVILRKPQQTYLGDTAVPHPDTLLGESCSWRNYPPPRGAAFPMVVLPSLWSLCVQWQVDMVIQRTYPLASFGTFQKGPPCFRACWGLSCTCIAILLLSLPNPAPPHCLTLPRKPSTWDLCFRVYFLQSFAQDNLPEVHCSYST